jgi:hypothetical protein
MWAGSSSFVRGPFLMFVSRHGRCTILLSSEALRLGLRGFALSFLRGRLKQRRTFLSVLWLLRSGISAEHQRRLNCRLPPVLLAADPLPAPPVPAESSERKTTQQRASWRKHGGMNGV